MLVITNLKLNNMGASKEEFTIQREYEERLEELVSVQHLRIKTLTDTLNIMKQTQENQEETIKLLKERL
jgi:stress response protein YsnF